MGRLGASLGVGVKSAEVRPKEIPYSFRRPMPVLHSSGYILFQPESEPGP